jgi:hypothetical protein
MKKKKDNQRLNAKLDLRRHFLRRYPPRSVFDACCGEGVVWSQLRGEFPRLRYWGVDKKRRPGRLAIDSIRILSQPGWDFDVVDVDTYGSPWEHWLAILPRVRAPLTVFLTWGLGMRGTASNHSNTFISALGLRFSRDLPRRLLNTAVNATWERVLWRAVDHGLHIVEAQEMVTAGVQATARYLGIRLELQAAPESEAALDAARKETHELLS